MKHIKKTMTATLITAGIIGTATLAVAIANADAGKNDYLKLADTNIQFNEAIDIAMTAVPGKVFEAELEMEDKQAVWEVEILSAQNQMVEIEIDANSGEIISQEIDDD